ncbi:MAG: AraC family transcriptional regulator [Chromatiaceae bacterium]|nr:AraC family transcriptional regulator [Chromatiaceae bacterium]
MPARSYKPFRRSAADGRLLRQAIIPVALFEEPEALVPLLLAHRFGEFTARSAGIEDLGLVVSQRTSAFELGEFGRSLQRSSTVYDYLRTGIQLIGSVSNGKQFWLSTEKDRLRFSQYLPGLFPGRAAVRPTSTRWS